MTEYKKENIELKKWNDLNPVLKLWTKQNSQKKEKDKKRKIGVFYNSSLSSDSLADSSLVPPLPACSPSL